MVFQDAELKGLGLGQPGGALQYRNVQSMGAALWGARLVRVSMARETIRDTAPHPEARCLKGVAGATFTPH